MNLDNDYLRDAQYRNNAAAQSVAGEGAATLTAASEKPASTAEVLSGKSVSVLATSDFEKLLATLKLETEEQKRKLAVQQYADAVTRLIAEADNLVGVDKELLAKIAAESERKSAAESDISKYSSLIDLKTQELASLTKELREIQQEINKRRRELKSEQAQAIRMGTDDETSLEELEARAAELKTQISAAETAVSTANQQLSEAQRVAARAETAIAEARSHLSTAALSIVSQAAKILAVAEAIDDTAAVSPEIEKMRAAGRKLVEELTAKFELKRSEELQEALDALVMKRIPASDLPGHEISA